MTKQQPTAKTPTVAIARVLRGLGLEQGKDFRVKGAVKSGERYGTYVAVLTAHADQVIADHANQIESWVLSDGGFQFLVSIHYTAGGRMWTWIANYGDRIRDTAPVATADKASGPVSVDTRKLSHELNAPVTKLAPVFQTHADDRAAAGKRTGRMNCPPVPTTIKARLGAPRPAFHQPHPAAQAAAASADAHPYDGLPQRQVDSLTWACEEAGQVWFFQNTRNSPRYELHRRNSPVRVNGWYLYIPGQDGSKFLGATFTIAATAAGDFILAHDKLAAETGAVGGTDPVGLKVDRTRAAWPKGTRVTGRDASGKTRNGTVNGQDVGVVTVVGHSNFGRAYAGVTWDSAQPSYEDHQRPFVDDLTRI